MVTYDSKEKILKFQKVEVPPFTNNLIDPLRESFKNYCTKKIHEDITYIFDEIFSKFGTRYRGMCAVNEYRERGRWSMTEDRYRYYPVYVAVQQWDEGTQSWAPMGSPKGYELFQIPYMDNFSRLSTRNGVKAFLSTLRPSEDTSFDSETGLFNVAMPNANIRIQYIDGKKPYVGLVESTRTVKLDHVIQSMLYKIGDSTNLHDILVGNKSKKAITFDPLTLPSNLATDPKIANCIKKFDPDNKLNGDMYNIGQTRNTLNELYNLNGAIGEIASRDIVNSKGEVIIYAGTRINKQHVKACHRNCINIIYVRDLRDDYVGYTIDINLPIYTIPAGTENCTYLRTLFPEYASYASIPVDITNPNVIYDASGYVLEGDPIIHIKMGDTLTSEMIEFLSICGISTVRCKVPTITTDSDDDEEGSTKGNKQDNFIEFSLEREIIGNYMVPYGELVDDVGTERAYKEIVYTYNNPTFQPTPENIIQHITPHDLLAIFSDVCHIADVGESDNLLNRDDAFLKKISMVDEQFSKHLRKIMTARFRTVTSVTSFLESLIEEKNMARGITDAWIFSMVKDNILATVEGTNIADEFSQLTHANIILKDPPDKMRHLAMPYYGRICPFETPSGKKLGLVNAKAKGVVVQPDGTMLVPYYKIINRAGRPAINTSRVHMLAPKDELGNKFVDRLDLVVDKDGYIEPGLVLARIPNPEKGEPFIVSKISTSELVYDIASGDDNKWATYVNVDPEQMLSLVSSLIPFLSCDDASRITFGTAQLKQTIYLVDSQVPRVLTGMYKDMLKQIEFEPTLAPASGKYVEHKYWNEIAQAYISRNDMSMHRIEGDDGKTYDVSICGPDTWEYVGSSYNRIHRHFFYGEHVNKGDVLVTHGDQPAPFVLRDARGHYTSDCAAEVLLGTRTWDADKCINNMMIFDTERVGYVVHNSRIMENSIAFTNWKTWMSKKNEKGEILTDTTATRNGYYSPSRNALVAYIIAGYNHEDGLMVSEKASIDYTSMIVHTITIKCPHGQRWDPILMFDHQYRKAGEWICDIYPWGGFRDDVQPVQQVYADEKSEGIPFFYTVTKNQEDDCWYVNIFTLGLNKLSSGDKMAGRHGNKGVVSYVDKNSNFPTFMNGQIPDILLSPLGIPSRMNLGQINEMTFGFVATLLNCYIQSDSINGASNEEVAMMQHFIYDYTQWLKTGAVNSAQSLVSTAYANPEYQVLPEQFLIDAWDSHELVSEWIDCFDRSGYAQMYDPVTDTYFRTKVSFGYSYFNKLEQEVNKKLTVRTGLLGEEYSATTYQPIKNENSSQGQRMGEMELINLVTYGASALLKETLNEKSDNLNEAYNQLSKILGLTDFIPDKYCQSAAVENLYNYLTALNVKVDIDPDSDLLNMKDYDGGKFTYDIHKTLAHAMSAYNTDLNDISEGNTPDMLAEIAGDFSEEED